MAVFRATIGGEEKVVGSLEVELRAGGGFELHIAPKHPDPTITFEAWRGGVVEKLTVTIPTHLLGGLGWPQDKKEVALNVPISRVSFVAGECCTIRIDEHLVETRIN